MELSVACDVVEAGFGSLLIVVISAVIILLGAYFNYLIIWLLIFAIYLLAKFSFK
jgi:hypothetical protein